MTRPRRGRAAKLTLVEAADVFADLGMPLERADAPEIKRKYRLLARKLHPDVRPAADKAEATRQLAQLNAAYETLMRLLAEKEQAFAREVGQGFDYDAYMREAMAASARVWEEAAEAAAGWRPPTGTPGVTREELRAWAAAALRYGFVRAQTREYLAHDPGSSLFSAWESTGYFGSVIRTRTLRKAEETAVAVATGVEMAIQHSAPGWRGSPLDLVLKLTVQPPRGQNPGHAAIAWVAGQDAVAQAFGHHTRWHSLSLAPRPERAVVVPKSEKLDRVRVEAMLRDAGMVDLTPRAWKEKRWAFPGATRRYKDYAGQVVRYTPEIVTKAKVLRAGARGELIYYGKATRADVDRWIVWARGSDGEGRGARGGRLHGAGRRSTRQRSRALPFTRVENPDVLLDWTGESSRLDWGKGFVPPPESEFLSERERFELCNGLSDSVLQEAALAAEAYGEAMILSRLAGMPLPTIQQVQAAPGQPSLLPHQRRQCEALRRALHEHAGNLTAAAIALGIPRSVAYARLARCGLYGERETARGGEREEQQEQRRDRIERTLRQQRGNVAAAARALRVSRSTLYAQMRRLGIPSPDLLREEEPR